jgi:predicted NBD/HSP70 family sugar kinase
MTASHGWTGLSTPERLVAAEVLLHGPLARTELAERLNLSAGSLTRLSTALLDDGILRESTAAHRTASGRLGRALEVAPDAHHFIGIRLNENEIAAVLTDLRCEQVAASHVPLVDTSPGTVVDAVAAAVEELTGAPDDRAVSGLGLGVGGTIDTRGTVHNAGFLGWDDVPLADLLRERLALPVRVANDVVALTTGVHTFGPARGTRDLAMLTIGRGIGSSVVVHGEVGTSVDAGVGLVGHLPLGLPGPECDRGHVGCAQAVLTDALLAARVSVAVGRPVDAREVPDLVRAGGDAAVERIARDFATGLGRLVATIAACTQVRTVLVAGEAVDLATVVEPQVHKEIAAFRDPAASELDLRLLPLPTEHWALGAATVAVRHFVSDPAGSHD